ncbi:uncharacterized protein LOC124930750 [Impatiens glandulifera]|uniref:uncharacterized protein LOC124930750 n=1 Tax=Impatiens glandulifera TaxID=253017 RepID=UPI001FB0A46C|nr:uncharacterized protein LOC124930750 [Impatiens glandulifera]
MFTDGLDSNALRWVKEGKRQSYEANNHNDDSYKVRNLRPIIGPLSGYGSRNVHGNISASASDDDDMSTDTEEEEGVYGGRRYLMDSSPQDDRARAPANASFPRQNYGKHRYATDSVYSDDISSSMETIGRRNLDERTNPGSSRHHPLRRSSNRYTDEEDSDESNASSEFSSTQPVEKGSKANVRSSYASDGYGSSVYSVAAAAADKVIESI